MIESPRTTRPRANQPSEGKSLRWRASIEPDACRRRLDRRRRWAASSESSSASLGTPRWVIATSVARACRRTSSKRLRDERRRAFPWRRLCRRASASDARRTRLGSPSLRALILPEPCQTPTSIESSKHSGALLAQHLAKSGARHLHLPRIRRETHPHVDPRERQTRELILHDRAEVLGNRQRHRSHPRHALNSPASDRADA
jgi:hypothetical protein